MKKPTLRVLLASVTTAAVVATLAACSGTPSGDDSSTADPDAKVTITVGNFPTSDRAEDVKYVTDQIAKFEEDNPNITIKTDTFGYSADTFAAALAGDTLPTVFNVPFTEPQGLIAAGQIADVTAALDEMGLTSQLNPALVSKVSDTDGNVYGLPVQAYSVGLTYNRAIFEQAGLDPNSPPTTWAEVREAAKTVTDTTGIPGFAMMATGNGGGWSLSALTYAFGGTIESADGTKSTLDGGATQEALETIQGIQQDGAFHNNLLLDFSGNLQAEFAAGKFAMMLGAPDGYYGAVLNNGMDPANFGQTGMPASDAADATLAGGSVAVVNATATPEEALAAMKWIKFLWLDAQLVEENAVAQAEAAAADGRPVGIPGLSLFSEDQTAEAMSWIEPYVNVPQENFQPWYDAVNSEELVAEPVAKAQDVYQLLDTLVQKVLSDPSADVAALVADYHTQLNDLLSR